jgi:hypothetical protein
MRKLTDAPIEEVPIGKTVTPWIAKPPAPGSPIRIVTGGRPYEGGCQLLASAWESIRKSNPNIELISLGPHFADLPGKLKSVCRDAGFIDSEESFRRFLSECHLAFVSGPDQPNFHGRWSFPSRTVDYLMAGLPIVACLAPEMAAEQVLRPITPQSVALVHNESEIVQGITRLTAAPDAWSTASRAARELAETRMSIEIVRSKVIQTLQAACNRALMSPHFPPLPGTPGRGPG